MKILIIAKHSKYEWERKKFSLSHREIVNKYNKERANLPAILKSHSKQLAVRDTFINVFNNSLFIMSDDIDKHNLDTFDLVIVLSGDNIFCKISHHVNNTPILGINSDPERSTGHLTSWAINNNSDVHNLINMLNSDNYKIKNWTRLEATIDGNKITPATNEYFFGERVSNKMSRHILVHNGREQEQKCSGILITTGSGSSGWYNSVPNNKGIFDPTLKLGAFIVREPYMPTDDGIYVGDIGPGDELILYSLNDDEGLVSVDSWEEFPFTRGSEGRISIGNPLRVLTFV